MRDIMISHLYRRAKFLSSNHGAVFHHLSIRSVTQAKEVNEREEIQEIAHQNTSGKEASRNPWANAKPYSEVPKPKGLPFVGTVLHYILNGGGKYLHEYVHKRHQQLGPILKEKYSTEPFEVLFIGDLEGSRDVYKNEGKTPLSFVIGGEQLYMELSGERRGLLFSQGEEWLKLRRPMNHLLLRRSDYFDNFDLASEVIEEHLRNWGESSSFNGNRVTDLGMKVNQIGVSTFGAFAFGERFLKHRAVIEEDAAGFYEFTKDYWNGNMTMQIIPPKLAQKLQLPVWRKFETAISSMLSIGRKWTELAKKDIADKNFKGKDGFLHLMLKEYDNPDHDTATRVFSDFIAALESETTMIQWIIYGMGQNPEAQKKVFEELESSSIRTEGLKWRQLDSMPYLQACIKESLRMYPSNCFTVRILPDDSLVKGYRVPAGTICVVSLMSVQRDPSVFPNPDKFWPERWFRVSEEDVLSANSDKMEVGKPVGVHGCQPYLPFAWGSTRGCIFRKISIKRMTAFLAKLVKLYTFSTKEVKPVMRTLMVPDRDMQLQIYKRTSSKKL